jgi:DNA invertase Pin-like site-specific DNA recombinase
MFIGYARTPTVGQQAALDAQIAKLKEAGGAIAQFERAIMLERQREGIAKAKAKGRYKGRQPTAEAKADQVRQLHAQGVRPVDIARQLGISRASVYRCLEP